MTETVVGVNVIRTWRHIRCYSLVENVETVRMKRAFPTECDDLRLTSSPPCVYFHDLPYFSKMASEEVGKFNLQENFEWNVENEIRLFEAMIGHKPVGINKHFHMACISEKFENLLGKSVSSDVIWAHLESMYDLAALDKKEALPFPNEPDEFSLPEAEYSHLINEKLTSKTEHTAEMKDHKEGCATPKTSKEYTVPKETVVKKEKRSDTEETIVQSDADKKETTDSETEGHKGKLNKEIKTRGKRSMKDKKGDGDLTPAPVTGNKKEDSNTPSQTVVKKEKQAVGKRTLRSRADDLQPSKSVTPPPVKRARRI